MNITYMCAEHSVRLNIMSDRLKGKYEPLGQYLRQQKTRLVSMTFTEIERVVGCKLPKSQRYPAWWSNNPNNNVMTKVWLDAGFESEQVDVEGRKLVFRRVREADNDDGAPTPPDEKHHPLIGWLEGTVQVAPGVDLTEPADPEWGDHAWADRPWSDQK
jgi:hypothetical protein